MPIPIMQRVQTMIHIIDVPVFSLEAVLKAIDSSHDLPAPIRRQLRRLAMLRRIEQHPWRTTP